MHQALSVAVVRLRPAQSADFPELARLRDDDVTQALLLGHPEARPSGDTAAWVARRSRDPNGAFFVIESGGSVAGFAQLTARHRIDGYAHFGIGVLPEARGAGVGRAAMEALIEHVRAMRLRKLLGEVRADNSAAIRLYRSLGFREIGVLQDHYDDGTRTWDVVVLEVLLQKHAAS